MFFVDCGEREYVRSWMDEGWVCMMEMVVCWNLLVYKQKGLSQKKTELFSLSHEHRRTTVMVSIDK